MSDEAPLEQPVGLSASSDYMAYRSQPIAYVEHTPTPLLPHFTLPEEEQNPLPQAPATSHSNMDGLPRDSLLEYLPTSQSQHCDGLAQSLLSSSDQTVLDVKAEGTAAEDTVCSVCLEDTLGACVCDR